jgi:hypothetical protein
MHMTVSCFHRCSHVITCCFNNCNNNKLLLVVSTTVITTRWVFINSHFATKPATVFINNNKQETPTCLISRATPEWSYFDRVVVFVLVVGVVVVVVVIIFCRWYYCCC